MTYTLDQVRDFMISAHTQVINKDGSVGQRNKYTGEPYYHHPLAVAGIVATIPGATQAMVAAALLHDTVEDTRDNPPETRVTLEMISQRFSQEVSELVYWLSDIEQGSRAQRDAASIKRLSLAPAEAQSIKCADIFHNCDSIVLMDPRYAPKYLSEKVKVLEALLRAERGIWQLAYRTVEQQLSLATKVG